jgi:hypothetical protein
MIFYSYSSRYFLLVKITTLLPINLPILGDSAYIIFPHEKINHFLIDDYQLIEAKAASIPPKSGI